MKKTYINPTIAVVKLQTVGMLAASLPTDDSTEQNLGRSFDFDDEEEY